MQNQRAIPTPQAHNPVTRAHHRREILWQVTVPLIVGLLLVAALAGGIILSGVGDAGLWADVSLIWLIAPALALALIPLAILAAMIYGLTFLLGALPPYAQRAQQGFEKIEAGVRRNADRAVEPLLRIHTILGALSALRRRGGPDHQKRLSGPLPGEKES